MQSKRHMSTGIVSSWKDKTPQHSYQNIFFPAHLFYPNSTVLFCIIIPITYLSFTGLGKKIKLQMYIPNHKKKKVLASKCQYLFLYKFLEHFIILYLKFICCIFKINVCTESCARNAKLWLPKVSKVSKTSSSWNFFSNNQKELQKTHPS